MVGAAARFLPALQVSEHHDRRRGCVVEPAHGDEPDADLRPVFAACAYPAAGAAVWGGAGDGDVQVGRGGGQLRDAGKGGDAGSLGDHSSDDEVAVDADAVDEG